MATTLEHLAGRASDVKQPQDGRRFPPRPGLTPVFMCAVAFWAATAAAYTVSEDLTAGTCGMGALSAAAGMVFCALLAIRRPSRTFGFLLAACLAGMGTGFAHAAVMHVQASMLEPGPCDVSLTVIEDSQDYGYGETALAKVRADGRPEAIVTARFGQRDPLLAGERLECRGTFEAAGWGGGSRAWTRGSVAELKVLASESVEPPFPLSCLMSFRRHAIQGIGDADDDHMLLQAVVCGYRRGLRGSESYAGFQACGLAHMVAVSGAHLVIVTSLMASLLQSLQVARKPTVFALVTMMASYYIVAGMPVSALRATIMASLGLFAGFGHRRASSLNAVGIGMFAIVASSPGACVSASFALSALSTTGIVLFAPLMRAWLEGTFLARAGMVCEALSLTMSAGLLSQLFACSLFNQLPIASPPANVATAPLFPLVCGFGLLYAVGVVFAPAFAGVLGLAPCAFARVLSSIAGAIASVPYSCVPFWIDASSALAASGAAALLLWALWPRDVRKVVASACAMAVMAAMAFAVTADTADRIVMLDVGQGDAILVCSRGESLLVDTGNQDARLLGQLARNRMTHVDSVLITHADDDHCGSLDVIRQSVDVDRVIVAAGMRSCDDEKARALMREAEGAARDVVCVQAGDVFHVGAFSMRVVWPADFSDDGGNADSLCLLAAYDPDGDGEPDVTAFFAGDAEKEQVAELLDSGAVGPVDILKVGHHGSRNGLTLEEANVLSPKIALISCGKDNRYGHPAKETLDILQQVGAATFRTDEDGALRCALDGNRVTVSCG